jgi:hypothetical protein
MHVFKGPPPPTSPLLTGEEEDGYGSCWQVDPANKDQTGPTKSSKTNITGYPGGVSIMLALKVLPT